MSDRPPLWAELALAAAIVALGLWAMPDLQAWVLNLSPVTGATP